MQLFPKIGSPICSLTGMTSQLGNEWDLLYQKLLLLNLYEQNHRVNSVRVDDWTAKASLLVMYS